MSDKLLDKHLRFKWLVGLSATIILFWSAYCDIVGLSRLFVGAAIIVGCIAGSFEIAKFVLVSYLTRQWKQIGTLIKGYFVVAVVVLTAISSAGIFAYMVNAYAATGALFENNSARVQANEEQTQQLIRERDGIVQQIADNNQSAGAIRQALVNNSAAQLQASSKNGQYHSWNGGAALRQGLMLAQTENATLRLQIAQIDSQLVILRNLRMNTLFDASVRDAGPMKRLSELFGITLDTLVKIIATAIVTVFDPLGILLLVSFNQMDVTSKRSIVKPVVPSAVVTKRHIKKNKVAKNKKPVILSPKNAAENNSEWTATSFGASNDAEIPGESIVLSPRE